MAFYLEAACLSSMGKIRSSNEDNFYFDGKTLEEHNTGLVNPVVMDVPVTNGLCLAVFDGMGGEDYGETASYTAAREMMRIQRTFSDFFMPESRYLKRLTERLNAAVVLAGKAKGNSRMGSTMAALYFTTRRIYTCNVGDSRTYRLRGGEFLQLSRDHVDARPVPDGRKALLTQALGIDPGELRIEPYIAKGEMRHGDQYLICSDGVTDMLTNLEIVQIMQKCGNAEACAEELIAAANARGGRDNITAIVCRIV